MPDTAKLSSCCHLEKSVNPPCLSNFIQVNYVIYVTFSKKCSKIWQWQTVYYITICIFFWASTWNTQSILPLCNEYRLSKYKIDNMWPLLPLLSQKNTEQLLMGKEMSYNLPTQVHRSEPGLNSDKLINIFSVEYSENELLSTMIEG